MQNNHSVAVLGSTGYVGLELVYLLSKINNIKIKFLGSENNNDIDIVNFDKRILKELPKIKHNSEFNIKDVDILFLALPHKISQEFVKKYYNKIKIIDLSADFRLDEQDIYKNNYDTDHICPELLEKFVYGLYEINHKNIKKSNNIAVPGCYPTSVLLPLIPLLKDQIIKSSNIIIDSKSGYSGAGKNFNKKNLFKTNDDLNFYNYNTNNHRHICEINQELNKYSLEEIEFSFNPHILPIFRGLMSTMYCDLKKDISLEDVNFFLKNFYNDFENIKVIIDDQRLDFNIVQNTNNCIIKCFKHYTKSKIIIVSAIDNLQKGAAGQAIQCMRAIL